MKLRLIVPLTVIIAIFMIAWHFMPRNEDGRGQTPLKADAAKLNGTIVTPHLEQKMVSGKNILWCSTFQLAWNELCSLAKGPVKFSPPSPAAEILNSSPISKSDLNNSAYVARAGFVSDGLVQDIQKELQEKFQGQEKNDLLRAYASQSDLFAYANLCKSLPFTWPFERYNNANLDFQGSPVQSFGIPENYSSDARYIKMAVQVRIEDVKNENDFIVRLESTSAGDELFLAKIPPLATLKDTINMVQKRIQSTEQREVVEMESLSVPVIDFDILKQYRELTGEIVDSPNKRVNGQQLGAFQSIQFRLDELGAVLKSEAMMPGCRGGGGKLIKLVFDKPFLILIKNADAKNPYFALWVGNKELLFPVKSWH